MNKPELLVETWGNPYDSTELNESTQPVKPLVEAIDEGSGKLYIKGIFMQAEKLNGNRRIYPKAVLEKAVDKYIRTQVDRKQALGETNHPNRPNVDPNQASILIESLWWEGNDVHGIARVIEGDFGPGDKLAANIRAGWIPGLSSRGLGTTTRNKDGHAIVNEGFVIGVGADVVMGPSAPGAYALAYIKESVIDTQQGNLDENLKPQDSNSYNEAFIQLTKNLEKVFG